MPPRGMPGGPRSFLTKEEKENMPKVTKALIVRILSYLKPYSLQFAFVFLAILISSVLGLLPSLLTKRIVDEALIGKDFEMLIELLIYSLITVILSQVIQVTQNYVNTWISQKIIYDMKNQMYGHLQYMSHAFFTTERQGDIITRMNSDIGGVGSVITSTLTSVVGDVCVVVTTLVALFSLNWKLAIVGIVIVPLLILPTRLVGKKRWSLLQKAQEKHDALNQHINETLSVSGSMLVKFFTKEKDEYKKFESVNNDVVKISLKEHWAGNMFFVVLGMFGQIAPLCIYLAGGIIIIKNGSMGLTVGGITAIISLLNRLYHPVRSLLNIQVSFVRSLALFTRIFDYYDRKQDIVSKPNAVKPKIDGADIEFCNVKFSYEKNVPILKDVSFKVPSGSMYAIVGASGAGKSTIIGLIPRLYDVLDGEVKINGVDVIDFDLEYLRRNIGVVTQDTYLFNGTIMQNLLYAKSDATYKEIEAVCKAANIHDFIESLPDKYDTIVGNRGLKLSGGEKQRISIARVMLKDPKILILDEATSALDSISENLIQEALEPLMKGRTSIVIAHRLSTVLAANKILVIDKGVIVEEGTHDSLLTDGTVYKKLYETQFKKVLEHNQKMGVAPLDVPRQKPIIPNIPFLNFEEE